VQQARNDVTGPTRLPLLEQQIAMYERLFQRYVALLLEQMTQLQREANRSLTPTVASSLRSAYVCLVRHKPLAVACMNAQKTI
jgi:hypothetical protein